MLPLNRCNKYELDFSKPTKSNSVVIGNRTIIINKKDKDGLSVKCYVAWDYKSKIQLAFSDDKDKLILFLLGKESDIEEIFNEKGLFSYGS